MSDAEADGDDNTRDSTSLEQAFEREYDDLGPVDFAKRVIEFGSWLEREGPNLSPAEKGRALAEYSFLQNRLSFWLQYEYTPPTAHLNLISAALTLYQGAANGGIVRPGDMPQSMMDVAGAAWAFDNVPPRLRSSTKPGSEGEPVAPIATPNEIEGLGGIVNNSEAKIVWWRGIKAQGIDGWEEFVAENNPGARRLPAGSKGFDNFNDTTGEAISAKTLNTLSVSYIKRPQKIFGKVRDYVDAAANYQPRTGSEPDPAEIQSRTIQLAIPEYTSPKQWRYLMGAINYGEQHGVSIVVTRIRE
jgi:filamentous hemagglutinin